MVFFYCRVPLPRPHPSFFHRRLPAHRTSCKCMLHALPLIQRRSCPVLTRPTCANHPKEKVWSGRYSGQMLNFAVPSQKCATYGGCREVTMHMEAAKPYGAMRCHMIIPYFHGVYQPPVPTKTAPWNLKVDRKIFLYFFGGAGRGPGGQRWDALRGMKAIDEIIKTKLNGEPRPKCGGKKQPNKHCKFIADFNYDAEAAPLGKHAHFFKQTEMHDLATLFNMSGTFLKRGTCANKGLLENCLDDDMFRVLPEFYIHGWEMYATSTFCWQPNGDTPTRRAFFDSWMFGCIPVV